MRQRDSPDTLSEEPGHTNIMMHGQNYSELWTGLKCLAKSLLPLWCITFGENFVHIESKLERKKKFLAEN